MRNILRGKYLFFMLLIFTTISYSQGTIEGVVTDSTSGETLAGANVIILGTSLGSATDLDGDYRVSRVPAGSCTIKVSYVGYIPKQFDIDIIDGETIKLNVKLALDIITGEEVIVTGQMRGQTLAINQQITSNTAVNIVSADRIQELPDANAAESIGRLPGVSLLRSAGEANKVVVRGLEPKLNAITINGVKVPSTGMEDRSVDLSMIASESLAGIQVFKATLPDMDAEAVGGAVNLQVKKAPDERSIKLKLSSGYEDLDNDWGNFKTSGEFSDRFWGGKFGVVATANYTRINRTAERVATSWAVSGLADEETNEVPIVSRRLQIRQTDEIRKRMGGSLTLDYKFDAGSIWLTNFYSKTKRNPFYINKDYDPQNDIIGYTAEAEEIDVEGFSNALNGEMYLWGIDMDWVLSRYYASTDVSQDIIMELEQGSPYNDELLDVYDYTTYVNASKGNEDISQIQLQNTFNNPDEVNQTDYVAQLNFKVPIRLGEMASGSFKFGGKYARTDKDRTSSGRGEDYYYLGGERVTKAQNYWPTDLILNDYGRITAQNFVNSVTETNSIVDDEYELSPIFSRDLVEKWGQLQDPNFTNDRERLAECYDLRETIAAGYLMAELNFGQAVTVITGARYEKSDNWYNSVWTSVSGAYGSMGELKDTLSTKVYDHWFPHFHLKLKPVAGVDVLFSVNKSLARPDYYWVSPWTRLYTSEAQIERGNPDLKETKVWNYNLTANLYNNLWGLFSVSGFYKDLKDVSYQKNSIIYTDEDIERLGIPGREGGYEMTSYENAEKAKVWGLEFELQTQLVAISGIPKFLQGVVINLNYSRIWSETYFPFYDFTATVVSTRPLTYEYTYIETERKGSMPGQAEHIANISLGYDIGNLSTRFSLTYQGKSISSVGEIDETDTWNNDFWRYDMSLKYKINHMVGLTFNLINITGQPDRTFFGSEKYHKSEDHYGMNAFAGIEISI